MVDPFSLAVLGGINLGLGGLKSAQAAKQRKQEMMTRAAELEASPWTGRGPATQVTTPTTNPWAEMAGSAINALGQAAALEKSGLFSSKDIKDTANKVAGETASAAPMATQAIRSPSSLGLISPMKEVKLPTLYEQLYKTNNASSLMPELNQNSSTMYFTNPWMR